MKKWMGLAAVLAVAASAYTIGRVAHARDGSFPGALPVGRHTQTFAMPAGFTALGKLGDPRRFADKREHRFVPEHYGTLISVTAHGEAAVLWLRDKDGNVRNVSLPAVSRRSFLLETQVSKIRQENRI